MQLHHKPTKILIFGKSGSGKSVYQSRFIAASTDRYDHYFIFDHKMEFHARMGFPVCYSESDCLRSLQEGRKFIVYNHSQEFSGDSESAFQFFSEWTFEMSRIIQRRSIFVTDEINRFTTSSDMGWEFRQLIEDGRLQGLDFVGTAHSANSVSGKLRLQLTEIVALKTTDDRALNFLSECGFDPDEVRGLETGQFIAYHEATGEFIRERLFYPANSANKIRQEPEDGATVAQPTEPPPGGEVPPNPPSEEPTP